MKQKFALWAPFVVMSVLTLHVDKWVSHTAHFVEILFVLAGLNLLLGIRVVARTWPKRWPIVLVFVGFVVGQWWLIATAWAFATWSIYGFAP